MSHVARASTGIERGCGRRQPGGTYLECGLSPYGVPLEAFVMDTPVPQQVECKVGIQMVEANGVWHILDWIGSTAYPYACDVLEEARRHGFSRRVNPQAVEWDKLTPASRLVLVHERGRLLNPEAFASCLGDEDHRFTCAKYIWGEFKNRERGAQETGHRVHLENPADFACNSYWYATCEVNHAKAIRASGKPAINSGRMDDLLPSEALAEHPDADNLAWQFSRQIGQTKYRVFPPAELGSGNLRPEFTPAVIASIPITNVSVIRARRNEHRKTLDNISGAAPDHLNVEENDA